MEGVTIASLIGSVGDVFSAAIGWVGDIAGVITGTPLLLIFAIIPLVGLGVGLFKRLLAVNG